MYKFYLYITTKMGTYNVPRNVKGEGRILFIFSTKSLIYTVVGAGIGLIFYIIFKIPFQTIITVPLLRCSLALLIYGIIKSRVEW